MFDILMKIFAKITIIVVENREPYYFIIICKCKQVPLCLFSYKMLASTLTTDDRSIYNSKHASVKEHYNCYVPGEKGEPARRKWECL